MLQTQTKEGRLVTLAQLTTSEIEFHREHTQFYCPTCRNPVMVRSGPQVIPHFAHYSQSDCPSFRRGEGPYHEKGKLLLYNWLKHQRLNVTLEKYIKEIDQQPDLYVQINQTKIAIEFQCSRIRLRDIQKRTSGYISAKIIPIWILGANVFERKSNYHLKIDQFTLQFIHQFSPQMPIKLFYFCPESLKILVFEDTYVTGRGRAIGNLQFYQLPKLKFTQLFKENPFSKKVLYNLWKSEKKNFRLQRRS